MRQLQPDSIIPLYVQLKDIIKSDIEAGIIKPGQKIPTEFELCEMYSISRRTVRTAISELIEEGLLDRKQGKGTFITTPKIQAKFGPSVLGFTEICKLNNLRPSSKLVEQRQISATSKLAEALNVPVNSSLVAIRRIMLADEVPVMMDYAVFTEAYNFLLQENMDNRSLYAAIKAKRDVSFMRQRKSIQTVFADSAQAQYLEIPVGYPLLLSQGTVVSSTMEIIHYGEQHIVGDKFVLYI
ncbi:GntR family transcriptional regulator [Paenibacillus jilunlii]|uniref:GntR family transcriptional regulator n=1 Tax=Paenibacillus jilunlii TaxID=682956 RepID=A0A1G9XSK1_9BACL|nr:GntR family transcriptional regulator [Paenibacillus jilunlii]KWX79730.1 hypothetical protein AML91_02205 [Paenibacillus jilunlii]SDM99802.1 GntR family transcriptional regulator [Paenibacillus jilunlii]